MVSNAKDEISNMYKVYEGYADQNFLYDFSSGDEEKFNQRWWEMYLTVHLINQKLKVINNGNSNNGSPDIKIAFKGKTIWIECISPTRGEEKNKVPALPVSILSDIKVNKVPWKEVLLRITSAIRDKFEKYQLYLKKAVVSEKDIFIIAINCSQLGKYGFIGKSQLPSIVEAVYPIGFNIFEIGKSENINDLSSSLSYMDRIYKANGSSVNTSIFLDKNYSGISGIIGTSRDEFQKDKPIVFVSNPLSKNKLPESLIKFDKRYEIIKVGSSLAVAIKH